MFLHAQFGNVVGVVVSKQLEKRLGVLNITSAMSNTMLMLVY